MSATSNTCTCVNCPGASCTCGCQNAQAAAQRGCQCGPACSCGPTCACPKE